jgi:fucose permease
VLLPLTEGRAVGWPGWSRLLLATAPVLGAAFAAAECRLERRGGSPLVPPSILRLRTMRLGLLLLAPLYAGFGAFMFVYAVLVQGTLGLTALDAGLTLTPMAVGYVIASLQLARLVARFGRSVVTAGACLQLVGLVLVAATIASSWPHLDGVRLAPALLVLGLGQGLLLPAVMRVVLSAVPLESAGAGSGVLSTTQQVALAFGVATLGSLFLTLQPAARLGPLHALDVVLGTQALSAIAIALGSRLLPSRT